MASDEKVADPPFERAYITAKDASWADEFAQQNGSDERDVSSEHLQFELSRLETRDDRLKIWVRILKFVSRALGFILSFATLIPLAMMTAQYLSTRNTYYNVNGTRRTAWPTDAETVFNNVFLSFTVVSFVLNIVILLGYFKGIQQANKVARVAAIWTGIILGVHIIVMVSGVAVYGAGADSKGPNGEDRDLWGWSCSEPAQKIQPFVTETDFRKWCNVQSTAYYIGIANAASASVTLTIYIFAILRKRSKKKIYTLPRRQTYDGEEPLNNVTWTPLDRKQSNMRQLCSWSSLDGKEPAVKDCSWAPIDGRLDGAQA